MTITTDSLAPGLDVAELAAGPVAYRDLGEGDPIVFVHGLLVDGRLWEGAAAELSRTHRCIVPDWPMGSHRLAMKPDADLTPTGMAAIVVSLLDELGIERATIVGNDSGGAISQVLTAHHPDRVERLILTNCDMFEHFPPFPFNAMPPIARLPGGMTRPRRAVPDRRDRPARVRAARQAPDRPGARRSRGSSRRSTTRDVKRDTAKFTAGIHKRYTLEAAERLKSFERPVRFAWATEDRFFKLSQAERLAAIVPDARIEKVADAGDVRRPRPAEAGRRAGRRLLRGAGGGGLVGAARRPHGGVASSTVPPASTRSTPVM